MFGPHFSQLSSVFRIHRVARSLISTWLYPYPHLLEQEYTRECKNLQENPLKRGGNFTDVGDSGENQCRLLQYTYFASPQLGPISMSHLFGTSKGTASVMILEIISASTLSFTDIATSS